MNNFQEFVNFYMKKITLFICIFICVGCGLRKEFESEGQTMGTTYHIKMITWRFKDLSDLNTQIKERLAGINRSMSTYIPDSEISRFNSMKETGAKFYISKDFMNVVKVAKYIHDITEGAWDGTIMPLVELWGFAGSGSDIREMRIDVPNKVAIKKILSKVGFGKIYISGQGYLQKRDASVSLDFASIAKGYAVDQLSDLISKNGINDFLVEIGGEVYASGCRLDGKKWRVGVNTPKKEAPRDSVYEVIAIKDKALATSGDYRNFFEANRKYYSHIIDPRSGYPVMNGVVSVSIVADTCVFADGLATGMMVMGPSKGLKLINSLDGVECLFVVKENGENLVNYYSNGFKDYQE